MVQVLFDNFSKLLLLRMLTRIVCSFPLTSVLTVTILGLCAMESKNSGVTVTYIEPEEEPCLFSQLKGVVRVDLLRQPQSMAAELEEPPETHFTERLAATVRNIQWSYAIFWSLSSAQEGVLAWSDGYYNGEIKTRKTTQPVELKADQMGLQRSEQLRELYGSLSAGESNQQIKRPSASLCPEDLTDTEWYYVVCMSFTFNPGQGLPGRALASNQHIWLSNAQFADSKIFSRCLLAKSASIQTVVCFPSMGGVLELGTSELFFEDTALIQHIRTCFWDWPNPVSSKQSISSSPMAEGDEDNMCQNFDPELIDTMTLENHILTTESQNPIESGNLSLPFSVPSYIPQNEAEPIQDKNEELHDNIHKELKVGSPDHTSNNLCPNQNTDDPLIMEELNGTSQVQAMQLMDNDFNNGFHGSLNTADWVSQSFLNPQMVLLSPKGSRVKNNVPDHIQDGNYTRLVSLDHNGNDSHYTGTLAAILRNSKQLSSSPYLCSNLRDSSFSVWKKSLSSPRMLSSTPQKLLKKILMDAVWMQSGQSLIRREDNGLNNKVSKLEGDDDAGASHVLSERRRREKLNEKFLVLRSLVPSISKVDKASILGDTIQYLKELERRVEELESCRELVDLDAKGRRKQLDVTERTSDNYGNSEIASSRKATTSKRKACDVEETEAEHQWVLMKDGPIDVNVTMTGKEVLVELQCPWRECLLLEIIEAISNLHLDSHSVQSSTTDGILALTIRTKHRGSVIASPGMIRKSLQRIVSKC